MKIPYLLHSVLRKIQEWIVVGPDQIEGPCSTPCSSHCPIGGANPKLYLVQDERERYGRARDQHLGPEDIDMGQERWLRLHPLPDPGEGLLPGLRHGAAVSNKIVHHPL